MAGKVKFIQSAVEPKDFPKTRKWEVAFTGRSNAGKSSLINSLCLSDVARVSKTPGKTRLLNFFELASYMIVDMPGYGWAARSVDEMKQYQQMIENYFSIRGQCKVLVLVMDCRRDWSEDEELLREFAHRIQKPLVIAATKADKLNKAEKAKRLQILREQARTYEIFLLSSENKEGVEEFEEHLFKSHIKPLGVYK
jgi:GTP-binding protein